VADLLRVSLRVAHDDVVDKVNVDHLGGLPKLASHLDVGGAGRGIAGGMIVGKCDVKSRASNCSIMKKPP
jgi:hypothetical protein